MTKKQQDRKRGIGARSLSVVLAVLMILSTLVIMLTATSLSTGAAISYWNIAGNFNDWQNSLNNSAYRINSGSGGSVTIPITVSSFDFKVVAYNNNNWEWYGVSGSGDYKEISRDSNTEILQNSGINMRVPLPANVVSVTFTVSISSGKTYIKVHANTNSVSPGQTGYDYAAKVNVDNSANSKDKIFWADATYYDYLSDKELTNGWLNPDHIGTSNFNSNIDEWYPFYNFNRSVVKSVADNSPSWSRPLYFGNFCNTYKAYDTSHHPGVAHGYNDATNSANVTRFDYRANNSNGVYDMYTSVQGLMGSTLQDGRLQTADGTIAPYFDSDALGNNAKIIKSAFPFRKTEVSTANGKYMRYEFDSTNARDNVYFDWNGSTPTAVNYGAGTAYGVKDGIKEFMNTESGYGIFPFNRPAGQSNGGNNQLDYGFGIRMDVKFRVPDNTEVKFDFSGDDDLWLYITDEVTKQSQLVLDMGGSHKKSEGVVNFTDKTSTVYKVDNPNASNSDIWVMDQSGWGNVLIWAWDNNGNGEWYEGVSSANLYRFHDNLIGSNGNPLSSKTMFKFVKDKNWSVDNGSDLYINDRKGKCSYTDNWSYTDTGNTVGGHCEQVTSTFDFDPSHTYTMTIFYMERGLIESNCKMSFSLTPLGNNFIVTETLDVTDINDGLKNAVSLLSAFGFNTYKNGSVVSDPLYSSFTLSDGGRVEIGESVLPVSSDVKINQSAPSNSYFVYDTSWDYRDNVSGELLDSGTGLICSVDDNVMTGEHRLINKSGDEYDYAELQVDYRNTPQIGSFSVKKEIDDDSGYDYSSEEFPITIYLQFAEGGDYGTYSLKASDGSTATNGRYTLHRDQTVTFNGIPVGTRVYVVEDDLDNYFPMYSHDENDPYIVSASPSGSGPSITVMNLPALPGAITGVSVEGTKELDGMSYTGNMFTFRMDGIAPMDGDADNVIDTSFESYYTDEVVNGVFTIDGLAFFQPGVYRYHLYEDLSGLGGYAGDIYQFGTNYLVQFTVTRIGFDLSLEGPVLIPYSEYEEPVTGPDAVGSPVPHTMVPGDFEKDPVGEASFRNYVKEGSVRIEKTDQNENVVNGAVFEIYRVDDDFINSIAEMSDVEKYNAVIALGRTNMAGGAITGSDGGFDDGIAEIKNLPIYQDGYSETSAPEYQQYVLIEREVLDSDDYAVNKTVHFFSFPINGQYDFTFSYINGLLKTPSTAGSGMTLYKLLGWGIAGFSVLALAGYMLYTRRFAKRKTAKHFIK